MKALAVIIATYFVVFAAGFGMGLYTMYLQQQPLIFAGIENANAWQQEAASNDAAAEYYRNNAELNVYTAEILKGICDNYTVENAELKQQIGLLEIELHKVLNPEWEINY